MADPAKVFAASYREVEEDLATVREALRVLADSVERDRREPDKILCHVLTARRALRSADALEHAGPVGAERRVERVVDAGAEDRAPRLTGEAQLAVGGYGDDVDAWLAGLVEPAVEVDGQVAELDGLAGAESKDGGIQGGAV